MAVDGSLRVLLTQRTQEFQDSVFLLWCTSVLRDVVLACLGILAVFHSTDITNAYRASVLPRGVCTANVDVAPDVDAAITIDNGMITDVGKASCQMAFLYVGDRVIPSFGRSGAMQYELRDIALAFPQAEGIGA